MRDDQRRRFARHIALPEIGVDGQEAILATRAQLESDDDVARLATTYLVAGGASVGGDGVRVHIPDRPDWWPGADGDEAALAFWRAGTAAAEWMLDVARRR